MKKYFGKGLALVAILLPTLAGAQGVGIGTPGELVEAYTGFYRQSSLLPIAQGTFIKATAQEQAALILAGLDQAKVQGRPFILDGATAYNKFYGAAAGLNQAIQESKRSGFFITMKFNESDFNQKPIALFKREDIDLNHFKNQYEIALRDMGVANFTVVMPHGNFFADYSDFLWAVEQIGIDPSKTAVGASNFLQKAALDAAKEKTLRTKFKFVAIEFEKHIRCNFDQVNAFLAENPDVFSFYVGVFGGKAKAPAYEFIAEGKEAGKSVPEHSSELVSHPVFSGAFSNPFELAANAVIRKHARPVVVMSTTNLNRLQTNYNLHRKAMNAPMEKMISELEAQGPSVRYDKGVRPEDKAYYKLIKPAPKPSL